MKDPVKNLSSYIIIGLLLFVPATALAGRPVIKQINRNEMIERSGFIFSGWPSVANPISPCPHETGRWWVHKVYKGDKSLAGKVIPVAESNYRIFAAPSGEKVPSYQAFQYKEGRLDREQATSFLFTNRQNDGCFELVANGAQEHRFEEPLIEALFSDPKDCTAAMGGFEFLVGKLPSHCQTDADCKILYLHPNRCSLPNILNKAAEAKLDADFKTFQARVRAACADTWTNKNACEPEIFPVRCRANRCEEGPTAKTPVAPLNSGILTSGCAPHDEGSIVIVLTDGTNQFPTLSINWWGRGKPHSGGRFNLETRGNEPRKDFLASYCPYRGYCKPLKSLSLKLNWQKDAATADFTFTTENDQVIKGSLPLVVKPNQALCG